MLLSFDTASPRVTAALSEGSDVLVERESEVHLRHGEQLAPLIGEVLDAAGVVRQDVTAVAVGVGPGPFTGLRVGLVTARTLAQVLEVPVYGACSLDVLALEAVETGVVAEPFLVATDARRKEVYWAAYDESGARIGGPGVDKPDVVASDLPVVGEGALLYPEVFPNAVGPVRPSAGWLARLVTEERAELFDPEPLYLRRPDAVANMGPKAVS